jgi:hypothetical protein
MTSKIYTLYLSTLVTAPVNNLIVPLNKTNLANVTWMIDFNNLFQGNNSKFRRCTVRHKLISTGWAGSDTDWESYSGILCCNLPSTFASSTNNGTILNIINPQTISIGGTRHCYISNTLGYQTGVDINMPSGVFPVTFSFYNDDALTFINNPNAPDWQMMMQFELSDPIEDQVLLDKYGSTF